MATENWAAKQQRKRQELLKNKCQTLGYGRKKLIGNWCEKILFDGE